MFYHPPSPAQSTLRNQQFVRHLSADPIEKAASTEINHAYTAMSVLSTSCLTVEETHKGSILCRQHTDAYFCIQPTARSPILRQPSPPLLCKRCHWESWLCHPWLSSEQTKLGPPVLLNKEILQAPAELGCHVPTAMGTACPLLPNSSAPALLPYKEFSMWEESH